MRRVGIRALERVAATAAVLVSIAACSSSPAPQPFNGPAPRTIAILPIEAPELAPGLAAILDDGVSSAVRARGYSVVAPLVMATAVPRGTELDLPKLRELRRDFGAEAVLLRTAIAATHGGAEGAFTVQWTILSTFDGKTLWSRRETVSPRTMTSRHINVGVQGDPGSDPYLSDEPVVGRGSPKWVTEEFAQTPGQQAELVQAALAARLPELPVDG